MAERFGNIFSRFNFKMKTDNKNEPVDQG